MAIRCYHQLLVPFLVWPFLVAIESHYWFDGSALAISCYRQPPPAREGEILGSLVLHHWWSKAWRGGPEPPTTVQPSITTHHRVPTRLTRKLLAQSWVPNTSPSVILSGTGSNTLRQQFVSEITCSTFNGCPVLSPQSTSTFAPEDRKTDNARGVAIH